MGPDLPTSIFERLGTDSRRVVLRAQGEARGLGHAVVDDFHLLLALSTGDDGPSAAVAAALGVDAAVARSALRQRSERPPGGSPMALRLTAEAVAVLEQAWVEARSRHADSVGAGHVALAIAEGHHGSAPLLDVLGVDRRTAQAQLRELVSPA